MPTEATGPTLDAYAITTVERFQVNAFEPIKHHADKDLLRRLVRAAISEAKREADAARERREEEFQALYRAACRDAKRLEETNAALRKQVSDLTHDGIPWCADCDSRLDDCRCSEG